MTCIKAQPTVDGGLFAALKEKHEPDEAVMLPSKSVLADSVRGYICKRCRLVYVPEDLERVG